MLLKQEFKSWDGVARRAAFENAHCDRRWRFAIVRFHNGNRDVEPFMPGRVYTWRLERTKR